MDTENNIKDITMLDNQDLRIVLEIPAAELIGKRGSILDYQEKALIEKEVSRLIADKIFSEKGKEIIEEVLKGVNWSDIVRSEVAQRVIKDIASGRRDY